MQDTKIQTCSMNELKRKDLCFICKEPQGLDHSCKSDIEKMKGVDQEKTLDFQDEDSSFIIEFMCSYEDTFEQHE